MRKIPEGWWSWIVPLILLFWILAAILTGCWPVGDGAAHAAAPSPSPAPHDPGAEVAFSGAALIGTVLILAGAIALVWHNMKKHSN